MTASSKALRRVVHGAPQFVETYRTDHLADHDAVGFDGVEQAVHVAIGPDPNDAG